MINSASDTAKSTRVLGLALLNQVYGQAKNICLSPISISCGLQLALLGAKGNTANEMLRVMGVNPAIPEILGSDCRQLLSYLQTNPQINESADSEQTVQLVFANSVWVHNTLKLNPIYSTHLQENYKAECSAIDFGNSGSVQLINAWISKKTAGRIKDVISSLSTADMFVLVNCAYFKAAWAIKFNKNDTVPDPFYLTDGNVVTVAMMRMICKIKYFGDETVQIAQLPYTDNRFSMLILLPSKKLNLENFVSRLSVEMWDNWIMQLSLHNGELSLPRFEIDYSKDLVDAIKGIGVRDAFSDSANFSNMHRPEQVLPAFKIDQIIHKTFIEVNEKGTEAAAATVVKMMSGMASFVPPPPVPPFLMTVDRPFVYSVVENTTGTILFMGKVTTLDEFTKESRDSAV